MFLNLHVFLSQLKYGLTERKLIAAWILLKPLKAKLLILRRLSHCLRELDAVPHAFLSLLVRKIYCLSSSLASFRVH